VTRLQAGFLFLIAAQAAHSLEEYVGHLWTVLPPARFVSGLVSTNLERGFVIANAALVLFGVWCFVGPVLRGWKSARLVAWGWAVLEALNGAAHMLWALGQRAYRPGLLTAPVLFGVALYVMYALGQGRTSAVIPAERDAH